MELKKKELIMSIFLVVIFLVGAMSFNVFAADNNEDLLGGWSAITDNKDNNTLNQIPTQNENTNSNTNTNVSANTNTPDKLADTGLESLPLAVIAICGISAIFAYKKIKEYKAY